MSESDNSDLIKKLGLLVAEMGMLEIELEDLDESVKSKKKKLSYYQEKLVPDLMNELGMKQITTQAGIQVEVADIVRASFPKDEEKRRAAFDWLKRTGDDGMIKRQFVVQYGKNSSDFAEKFALLLEEHDIREQAEVTQEQTINHNTLLAYLRKELVKGTEPPLESFGAFIQTVAKIKRGK